MTHRSNRTVLQQLDTDLHDLCQPLTALQCRLEIGNMLGREGALQEAVDGGLEESQRMFEVITRMRQHLIEAQEFSE